MTSENELRFIIDPDQVNTAIDSPAAFEVALDNHLRIDLGLRRLNHGGSFVVRASSEELADFADSQSALYDAMRQQAIQTLRPRLLPGALDILPAGSTPINCTPAQEVVHTATSDIFEFPQAASS